jgi:hypothetical protein
VGWLYDREVWGGLETIVRYRTFRRQKGKEPVQTDHYYISSGDFSAEEFLKYIRGHWSIENQLHWMQNESVSGRRMLGKDGERGSEYEYSEEDDVTPAEENEDGEETCQRQTPHDACHFGFGVPVRGTVLRVNVDALVGKIY